MIIIKVVAIVVLIVGLPALIIAFDKSRRAA
jgi:hypothetical protein